MDETKSGVADQTEDAHAGMGTQEAATSEAGAATAQEGPGAAATAAAATTANHDAQSAQESAGEGGTAQEAAAAAVEVTEGKPAEQDTPPASAKADAAQKPDGARREAAAQCAVAQSAKRPEAGQRNGGLPPAGGEPPLSNREIASMRRELLTARAEAEAARLLIPAERVPYVLRLAELDGIDPKGRDAAQQVRAAIDRVLGDVPELRGGGTGATGAFKTQRAAPKDAFERGFDRK